MKHTVTITITDVELNALLAVITTADQANHEWAKSCGESDTADAEAKAIGAVGRLHARLAKAAK